MSKEKILSERQAVILSILVNGKRYGREIRNEYEKRTGRKLPLGSLYTTLSRMETHGFVTSWLGKSAHERGGNRRKYFRIRAAGSRALDAFEVFAAKVVGGMVCNV